MDSRPSGTFFQQPGYEKLSSSERTVFHILKSGRVPDHDIARIAKLGNLSELHVKVAMRLLFMRNMTDINPDKPESNEA